MYRHYRNPAVYSLQEARRLVQQALEAAAELRRDIDLLPRTGPDGSSDCPFAEALFYQKEKTALFVRDDLGELRRFLRVANSAIAARCSKADEIAHGRESLNGESAQDQFAKAELELRAQIQDHQNVRRDLLEAIAELEATLREADSRRFPGGDPRGPFGQRVHGAPQVARPLKDITDANAKEEIERLMRMTNRL